MDLFRKLMDRGDGQSQGGDAAQLQELIARAQEERRALEASVAAAEARATHLSGVNAALDENERRAAGLAEQLESLAARIGDLEAVRLQVQGCEARVVALEGGVQQAEERVRQAVAREAELQEDREAVERLASLGHDALVQIEALKQESASLAQLEERLPRLRHEFQPLFDQQAALKSELDLLRGGIATLAQDAESSREAALKARAHATKASDLVGDLQSRLEPLSQLHALSQDTDAQLRSLNALAEHVAVKVKALENQQSVVERALVESRRVHEMVWDMEAQIGRLNDGSRRAAKVAETVAALERLQAETTAQLEEAGRAREAFGTDVERQEHDARGLVELVQRHLDQLAVHKQELEALHERLRVAQTGISAVETRVDAVSAREQELAELVNRIDDLATAVKALTVSAETLQRKQAALGALEERLDALEAMAKRTEWQFEGLAEHRKDLETLKTEIQTVHTTYEQTATLLGRLRDDKREVEHFLDKAGGFMSRASEIEGGIDALTTRILQAEESAGRTTSIAGVVEELANRLETIAPRVQVVEDLEGRLNALNDLSTDVDRRMSEQLARRAELESLGALCDGVTAQVADAQQKLAAVNSAHARLEPAMAQLSALQDDMERVRAAVRALERDEEALAGQQRRMTELSEATSALAADVAQRLETVHGLQEELGRAGALKEQLLGELSQIQRQERETFAHLEAAEDQFKQLDALWKKLEHRRSQLDEAEHAMAEVEGRMHELRRVSDEVERRMAAIAEREQIVEAVRRGIEGIHALSLKSQADLETIGDRRAEIARAMGDLDRLRESLASTQEKIVAIESRRQLVDDVQRKTDTITHILGDVQVTLDSVCEQKAMVDHVFSELARLEYLVQEARGTMKALQAERDVAQRIVENVRHIHARTTGEERKTA